MQPKLRSWLWITICCILGASVVGGRVPAALAGGPAPFILTEGDGTRLTLAHPPQRVVVLSIATAEILLRLGVRPVGVTTGLEPLPPEFRGVATVGMGMRPDLEKIRALRPDLVIAGAQFKATLQPILAEHGLRACFIANQRYQDTLDSIAQLGKAFDRRKAAQALLTAIKKRERIAVARIAGRPAPRVMIIFGTSESFLLARENSYVGDLVKTLRGINVAAALSPGGNVSGYIPFSLEKVVESDPDVILRIAHGNPESTMAIFRQEFANDPVWRRLEAVRRGRVYDLPADLFFANPGLRCIDALEKLAEVLYGPSARSAER